MSQLALNPLPPEVTGQPAEPAEHPVLQQIRALVASGKADLGVLTKVALQLRDKKKEIDAAAKERTSPLTTAMDLIENHLLARFTELGVDNVKTPFGTPYVSKTTSYSVADGEQFQRFVLSEALAPLGLPDDKQDAIVNMMLNSGALSLLETRAAKSAIEQYTGPADAPVNPLPPGLNMSTVRKVNFRAA